MDFTVFEVRSTHTVKDKTKSLFFRESISKYSRISDAFQGLYLKIIEARNTHTDAQLKYFWALNSGMGAQGVQTLLLSFLLFVGTSHLSDLGPES